MHFLVVKTLLGFDREKDAFKRKEPRTPGAQGSVSWKLTAHPVTPAESVTFGRDNRVTLSATPR